MDYIQEVLLLVFLNIFKQYMIDQVTSKEIISLWIGKQSQKCAFSFYNLQAQQIFDEEQDPILHSSLWKNVKKMQPRMIVFDTNIERLATVRQVNNKKIIQKMQKQQGWSSLMGMFQQIDTSPITKNQDNNEIKVEPQFNNWTDKQSNYFLIDQGYTSMPSTQKESSDLDLQRFHTFSEFYRVNQDQCENRLRKELENTDFLKLFSVCTDQSYSGYTSRILQYLREQCPKKAYLLTSLSPSDTLPIASLSKIYDEVDILLPINTNCHKYSHFKNSTFSKDLAPFFSTLLTPFAMKDVDPYHYISTIISDNRRLFNAAFTLPIINTELNLNKATSIFRYEQAAFKLNINKDKKLSAKQMMEKIGNWSQKNIKGQDEQEEEIRINFTNSSYISLVSSKSKGKFLSQSYVLRGHFNDFQKIFQPKSEPSSLSIKYLQGIFSAVEDPPNFYDKFYQPQYGTKIEAYPYHLAMFSHENFGESIRKHVELTKKTKVFNEDWPECREKVLHIADSYLEQHSESD